MNYFYSVKVVYRKNKVYRFLRVGYTKRILNWICQEEEVRIQEGCYDTGEIEAGYCLVVMWVDGGWVGMFGLVYMGFFYEDGLMNEVEIEEEVVVVEVAEFEDMVALESVNMVEVVESSLGYGVVVGVELEEVFGIVGLGFFEVGQQVGSMYFAVGQQGFGQGEIEQLQVVKDEYFVEVMVLEEYQKGEKLLVEEQ